MPLITTPAVILHVMPYGETSKILRLLTRDLGLQSAIARGARHPRSPTGPRLDLFTFGTASLRVREHRELSPLTGFEIADAHAAIGHDVGRFGAASALAELALKCAPAERHPAAFDAAAGGLAALAQARAEDVEAVGLAACWALVRALGFCPTLERCAGCGAPLAQDGGEGSALHFSAALGGAVCTAHRTGAGAISTLGASDREALAALLAGLLPEPALDARHAAAHRRLLLAFIRHHLAEDRPLPAMVFWDREAWNATSS
jgi:DNA repair protein RecO (recombination protein O)